MTDASFPAKQRISEPATLKLEVANRGDRAVPNLAVIVETARRGGPGARRVRARPATTRRSPTPRARSGSSTRARRGGESVYTNTWAVGPLGEGQSRTVEWKLTAMRPGSYTVAWRLAPALVGDVTLADGRTEGEFAVTISDRPVPARVNDDGEVVRGEEAGR